MIFSLFLLASSALAANDLQICYFSLNEESEFHATKDFMDKLNAVSPTKITVKEFMPEGGDPDQSFKKMVESGTRCDGLVISGHHTGSYGGKRAKDKRRLSLDTIENMSCDPRYANWFRSVSATWLQGCRTLGVGEIEANDEQADVDFHTNRVGRVLEEDGLGQNFADLNMEFSSTLDQDNPLASRYLRLFPASKVFGWTRSAPGNKSQSWKSLLYHMAQTSRLLDSQDAFPKEAPDANQLSPESAAKYANAVLFTLKNYSERDRDCEDIAVTGWLAHGGVGKPGRFSFENPDLRAYSSLANSGNFSLQEAREIDCALKSAAKNSDPAALAKVLDRILSNPEYFRYSFNTIVDLRSQLAKKKDPKAELILQKMRNHPGTKEFLDAKMESRQVGVLRKIDYYRFQEDLFKRPNVNAAQEIANASIKELLRTLPELTPNAEHPERSRTLAANYRATLFQSLIKNKMVGPKFYNDLLQGNPEGDVLYAMATQAGNYGNAKELLTGISFSPKADKAVASAILKTYKKQLGASDSEYEEMYNDVWGRLRDRQAEWQTTGISYSSGPAPERGRERDVFTNPLGN